ncbi:GGDEF domain-containing protein [Pleionea sp. CnH1-48]|uniref:GGDEF domain-containing protein n=1 Tax=Pleionea sp. CnH1-48 TaxID=2954494 RepID=UPI0020985213|nr:GGDEF domain-containing protein [Pleionea sp. CnH1-48]MCO7227156.1 GGDEF domain-containing protein [Pleionea sp. CnH1-48]
MLADVNQCDISAITRACSMYDNDTITTLLFLISSQLLIVSGYFWLKNKATAGTLEWFLAALLFFLRDSIPVFQPEQSTSELLVLLTNTLILIAYVLILKGCFKALNLNQHISLLIIWVIVGTGFNLTAYWVGLDVIWRVSILCIFLASLCFYTVYQILKTPKGLLPDEVAFLLYILLTLTLLYLFRMAGLFLPDDQNLALNTYTIAQLIRMAHAICIAALFYAALMIISGMRNKQLQYLANIDGLTGILNRRALFESLKRQIKRHDETAQGYLLIIDIDYFKKINDQHGHLIGDKALRHIVELVQSNLRSTDTIGRYGGEEFVVYFPNIPENLTLVIADRIREGIENSPITCQHTPLHLTVSIGIAKAGESLSRSIKQADEALYHAKQHGRNQIALYGTYS